MANTVEFCSILCISACRVSSEHLNYEKHSMVRVVYRFHIKRILKRLQIPLPHKAGFNAADNPYTSEEFFKICEDYGVSHDPMKYRHEKFYWTYQHGIGWPVIT